MAKKSTNPILVNGQPSPFGPRETQRILVRRKKWTDALRSGEYEQTQSVLEDQDMEGNPRYCCLGVAREVCKAQGGMTQLDDRGLQKLGLSDALQQTLISLNDEDRKNFKYIANVIDNLPIEKDA